MNNRKGIGEYHRLKVCDIQAQGVYLGELQEKVLLPNRFVPEGVSLGDELKVFIYLDSDGRPVATTQTP